MKNNCILKQKVIKSEIEVMNPTHIIFLTHNYYDIYINTLFDNIKYITDKTHKKKVGKKNVLWGHYESLINNHKVNILRTSHPERKQKIDYVNAIVYWINKRKRKNERSSDSVEQSKKWRRLDE